MTPSTTTEHRSALDRFFRNPDTGEVVVVQPPNVPLMVWITATLVRLIFSPDGGLGLAVSIVATVSLAVWSLLELARGESPFRRTLGGLVLLAIVAGLLLRL